MLSAWTATPIGHRSINHGDASHSHTSKTVGTWLATDTIIGRVRPCSVIATITMYNVVVSTILETYSRYISIVAQLVEKDYNIFISTLPIFHRSSMERHLGQ